MTILLYVIAPGAVDPLLKVVSIIGTAAGAGAAGALNMWYDADIDAVMTRTAGRPIPDGRVSRAEALGFGLTLACGAVGVLALALTSQPRRCLPSRSSSTSSYTQFG
jgi:protoheme IX farnesyltransferase